MRTLIIGEVQLRLQGPSGHDDASGCAAVLGILDALLEAAGNPEAVMFRGRPIASVHDTAALAALAGAMKGREIFISCPRADPENDAMLRLGAEVGLWELIPPADNAEKLEWRGAVIGDAGGFSWDHLSAIGRKGPMEKITAFVQEKDGGPLIEIHVPQHPRFLTTAVPGRKDEAGEKELPDFVSELKRLLDTACPDERSQDIDLAIGEALDGHKTNVDKNEVRAVIEELRQRQEASELGLGEI